MKTVEFFALVVLGLVAGALYHDLKPSPHLELHGTPTRYPIVLAHGILAGPRSMLGVQKALIPDDHFTFVTEVPPIHGVVTRAKLLAGQIDHILALSRAEKINIIAHSMGGLDARYLITQLGYADKVASLTTISTPHRGTNVADAILGLTRPAPDPWLNDAVRIFGRKYVKKSLADLAHFREGFRDISERQAPAFNAATPNADGVYYQSWAGLSTVAGLPNPTDISACTEDGGVMWMFNGQRDPLDILIFPLAPLAARGSDRLPGDGVVAVESARWGRFRGCIPADHLDVLGLYNDVPPNPRTGFDYVRFYREMAFELAIMGF